MLSTSTFCEHYCCKYLLQAAFVNIFLFFIPDKINFQENKVKFYSFLKGMYFTPHCAVKNSGMAFSAGSSQLQDISK